jgi:hypothetical protein
VNRLGREVTLTIDENTEPLVLATWCGYSRQLNAMLKDAQARQHLRGKRLVYVFDYNELAHHLAPRVRSGEITQASVDDFLNRQPRGAVVSYPDFLTQVAADDVLFYDARHPLRLEGFPSAFSGTPNVFELDRDSWMEDRLGITPALQRALYKAHPLGG